MHQSQHLIRAICAMPWAIMPEKLDAILELVELRAQGVTFTAEEIAARVGPAPPRPSAPTSGAIAVLPLYGVIAPRMDLMTQISGGTSTKAFGAAFAEAVADDAIQAILIDVDSPGGQVQGVPELARQIFAARGRKPITALGDAQATSAAYWIASAADEIVVTPSGLIGSIGVYTVHTDVSGADAQAGLKRTIIRAPDAKAEGLPYEPLSAEAHGAMSSMVQEFYDMFVKAIAEHRRVSQTAVREGYGRGRALTANQALKEGMVDRIGTFDETVERLSAGIRKRAAGPRAASLRRNLALAEDSASAAALVDSETGSA